MTHIAKNIYRIEKKHIYKCTIHIAENINLIKNGITHIAIGPFHNLIGCLLLIISLMHTNSHIWLVIINKNSVILMAIVGHRNLNFISTDWKRLGFIQNARAYNNAIKYKMDLSKVESSIISEQFKYDWFILMQSIYWT